MDDAGRAVEEHVALAGRIDVLLPIAAAVAEALIACYERGGRVYTFGNGGSAADSLHFAEELVIAKRALRGKARFYQTIRVMEAAQDLGIRRILRQVIREVRGMA